MLNHLTQNWTELVGVAAAVHVLALAIVNLTPTPKDDAVYGKVYKAIELLAGIVTKLVKK
jgi:hypothetical protein